MRHMLSRVTMTTNKAGVKGRDETHAKERDKEKHVRCIRKTRVVLNIDSDAGAATLCMLRAHPAYDTREGKPFKNNTGSRATTTSRGCQHVTIRMRANCSRPKPQISYIYNVSLDVFAHKADLQI